MSNVQSLPAQLGRHENLPSLLVRAGQRLLNARNSAEVLEAKKLAELALHYSKVTKAANETHADCLRIITRAEMRMANEIDRGQAAGEITRHGGDRSKVQTSDLADLGLDKRRVADWRETRDAGEEVVESAICDAVARGKAPTKADIRRRIRGEPDQDGDDIESEVEPANYKGAFLMRADLAVQYAQYSGPITKQTISAARAVAAAWESLAQKMEKAKWQK